MRIFFTIIKFFFFTIQYRDINLNNSRITTPFYCSEGLKPFDSKKVTLPYEEVMKKKFLQF